MPFRNPTPPREERERGAGRRFVHAKDLPLEARPIRPPVRRPGFVFWTWFASLRLGRAHVCRGAEALAFRVRVSIENAQAIAAHESPRTTKLYDRTEDEITLDEIERIVI